MSGRSLALSHDAVEVDSPIRLVPVQSPRSVAPPHGRPDGFTNHTFELEFELERPRAEVWRWLEDPDTFARGQVWPFRVEFVSPQEGEVGGFETGHLNIHHGPLLGLAGVMGEIREEAYRDLHYFYGSYVLSLRLIRPTRLEFWVDDARDGGTRVTMRLTSFVHRRFARTWGWGQRIFWRRFSRWMARSLGAASPIVHSAGTRAR